MKKTLLAIAFVCLISCNKNGDFSKVTEGMTPEEVVKVVGEPEKQVDSKWLGVWYAYDQHIVVFKDGGVIKVASKAQMEKQMEKFNK